MGFYDFYRHYYVDDNPPVMVSRTTGDTIRHGGGSHRCAFWAGYDNLSGGVYGPDNTAAGRAYRAGAAYRRAVDAGRRDPLPDPSPGLSRTGSVVRS